MVVGKIDKYFNTKMKDLYSLAIKNILRFNLNIFMNLNVTQLLIGLTEWVSQSEVVLLAKSKMT